ncbi:hypothetical protein PR202_ga07331 [Eleusine coracana subsp. coracana]|uniref:Transposase (putative) gypsy type domain-containing protein n=1 Tax=Eleusine coracana subsp. coracana TaxID=191504 RepID=A0AAV5BYF8_ELECO|nr:hypothetical protein PR202_ga07331 [Eleusine coracana subsp. coracana]
MSTSRRRIHAALLRAAPVIEQVVDPGRPPPSSVAGGQTGWPCEASDQAAATSARISAAGVHGRQRLRCSSTPSDDKGEKTKKGLKLKGVVHGKTHKTQPPRRTALPPPKSLASSISPILPRIRHDVQLLLVVPGDVKPSVGSALLAPRLQRPHRGRQAGGGTRRGAASGRRVHDDAAAVSRQFRSTLRTLESIVESGLASPHIVTTPDTPSPNAQARRGRCRGLIARASAVRRVDPRPRLRESLAAGMRLPLDPFVSSALTHYGIAPSQLAPNGWRVLSAFAALSYFRGAGPPSLPVFRHFFALYKGKGEGWYSIRGRRESSPALIAGLPGSGNAWKEEFLLVAPPPGAPWPCPVRWGVPSKEAMRDPVLTKGEAAVAKRLAQGHGVVDLKTYLSETNLSCAPACIGVGLHLHSPRSPPAPEAKKRKAPAAESVGSSSGGSCVVLRSKLEAKAEALTQAEGKISKLEQDLEAKKKELVEVFQLSGELFSKLLINKIKFAQELEAKKKAFAHELEAKKKELAEVCQALEAKAEALAQAEGKISNLEQVKAEALARMLRKISKLDQELGKISKLELELEVKVKGSLAMAHNSLDLEYKLKAKEEALAQAKGKINKLEQEQPEAKDKAITQNLDTLNNVKKGLAQNMDTIINNVKKDLAEVRRHIA